MEINIKDKLKNLSGEKIKGSLMHDFGIGRIVIIIICAAVILAGSLFDGDSVVKESDSRQNTENENILSEDDALDIMNKYAKQQEIKLKTMLESMDGVGEWMYIGNFYNAIQDFRIGIPGMCLQVFGGYLFIRYLIRK